MKHNYLYQGWAGNTYSHKCTGNSKVIYYELTDNIDPSLLDDIVKVVSANIKVNIDGTINFITGVLFDGERDNIIKSIALAFMPMRHDNININSLEEYIEFCKQYDGPDIKISDIIKRRLTAEEYWDTTVPNLTFTLGIRTEDYTGVTNREGFLMYIKTYEFEPGMTMSEWCDSKYNVDGIQIFDTSHFRAQFYRNGKDYFQIKTADQRIKSYSNLVDYFSNKQYVYDEITGEGVWINFTATPIED